MEARIATVPSGGGASAQQGSGREILVLCYEYPPLGGGGGVGAKQYAEAWADLGYGVTVITGGTSDLPGDEIVNGVRVVRVPILGKKDRATSTMVSMFAYLVSGTFRLIRSRRSLRRSSVINTHFSLPTGPLGWVATRVLNRPQVLTIIGGDIYDPSKGSSPHRHALLRSVNRFLIRSADRVVAISSDTLRRAREHYGIRREIRVINYGFSAPAPDEIEETELPEDRFHLITVGRLVPRKGFDHLIRAVAGLPEDVRLLMVGDGPEESRLRELAEALGVVDRVQFLGYQSRARLYGLLHAADCYVLSSLHEGLGIVVQEAMFAGLPVVATDNGGQVDLIQDGRNGILVPPADPPALRQGILEFYRDRRRAGEVGERNRRDLRRLYMDENRKEYLDVFEEVSGLRAPVGT